MDIQSYSTCRLVKGEDLNHHGTLFAGRSAEWFVESGFIAAAGITRPESVVCVKIHGMSFSRPVLKGHIISYVGRVIHVGRTKLISHVKVLEQGSCKSIVEGFLTFVHVDMDGRPTPHGIGEIRVFTEEDRALQEQAKKL